MNLVLVADNIRSIENTGALFRLADGVGATELILIGITPYPDLCDADTRRPWLRQRTTERLRKTALSGFEVPFHYFETHKEAIDYLRRNRSLIVSIEQGQDSISMAELPVRMDSCFRRNDELEPENDHYKNVALIVGHEVDGVSKEMVEEADVCVEIPMYGKGKSLNVAVAAGIVAYQVKACIERL